MGDEQRGHDRHLLVCKGDGKGAGTVFIHEIRIRSAEIADRHRSRALVDFSAGAKAGSYARYVRAAIVLGPSRPKFACRIKMAHCKQQSNLQRLGNFVCKTGDEAPRMTVNNNEHQ
ncbi:MAG TPA: hypothetical protein VG291_00260 [Xanthobacteraceae bacterium]|nr:hypothetical protein [Xanthobacteraceae bacterium]